MQKIVCALALLFLAVPGNQENSSAQGAEQMSDNAFKAGAGFVVEGGPLMIPMRNDGGVFVSAMPNIAVAGDWQVHVTGGVMSFPQRRYAQPDKNQPKPKNSNPRSRSFSLKTPVTLDVAPAETINVQNENYDALPIFNVNTAGWGKGAQLRGVVAMEVTAPDYVDPQSVIVKSAPDGEVFTRGKDYEIDAQWATIGRLPNGKIGEATKVFISYKHGLGRLDSIVADMDGNLSIRRGEAKINLPQPPAPGRNETRLANIWVFGRMTKLTDDNIFPITSDGIGFFSSVLGSSDAERLLPKTLAKLRNGQPLKILAWGDSVTDAGYLPTAQRWQNQFVARLQKQFPKAKIELLTQAWGGRNTQSYLDEPPGSPHNYREQVLALRPDLIVSEFVNDANLTPPQVEERYGNFLKDFKEIGAEWIIQTPHYVTPAWMGLTREKNVEADPRPYVAGLRVFAANHNVALTRASERWGHLYKQGLPYTTLLGNMVNHPDARGMAIFADALIELFPQK